jgi:hypothetical protein
VLRNFLNTFFGLGLALLVSGSAFGANVTYVLDTPGVT